MRATTWLLMEHLKLENLALLVEWYILPDNPGPYGNVDSSSVVGGHWEFIMDSLKIPDNLDPMLHGAAEIGDTELIEIFVARGAKNLDGSLRGAASRGHIDAARALLMHGASAIEDIIYDPAKNNDVEMCQLLVKFGVENSRYLLYFGGFHGNAEMVDLANPNCRCEWEHVLKGAINGHKVGSIVPLIAEGADPNYGVDILVGLGCCWLATHIAEDPQPELRITKNSNSDHTIDLGTHIKILDLLLSNGADPNTGLSLACSLLNGPAIKYLIGHGATECECGLSIGEHSESWIMQKIEEAELARRQSAEKSAERRAQIRKTWVKRPVDDEYMEKLKQAEKRAKGLW